MLATVKMVHKFGPELSVDQSKEKDTIVQVRENHTNCPRAVFTILRPKGLFFY